VIVPPYTFLATATAVVACNATPVFVDVELDSFNIDPAKIESAIRPRTRAIIPVHFGGIACDMEAINNIAHKHKLIVIEDAAHAHGSEYKTRRAGSLADIGSFSFQSSKNLTCGEGGILTTNDDRLAGLCRSIHNCGRIPQGAWYEHHLMSGNFRLGEFQGAVLNRQLDRLDDQTDTRDRNGKYLDQEFTRIPGIRPQQRVAAVTRSAYHLYCFRFDQQAFGIERARFIEAMNKEGIPVSGGYILPLNEQPLFAKKSFGPYTGYPNARPDIDYANAGMANCQRLCSVEACWLTQNVMLGTRADMDDIVRAIRKVYDNRAALAEGARSTVGAAG
jgi:dTDP-4-amino-4,6-dideoxygalactose transaminase